MAIGEFVTDADAVGVPGRPFNHSDHENNTRTLPMQCSTVTYRSMLSYHAFFFNSLGGAVSFQEEVLQKHSASSSGNGHRKGGGASARSFCVRRGDQRRPGAILHPTRILLHAPA